MEDQSAMHAVWCRLTQVGHLYTVQLVVWSMVTKQAPCGK